MEMEQVKNLHRLDTDDAPRAAKNAATNRQRMAVETELVKVGDSQIRHFFVAKVLG